ncbi:MAG TPA: BTAD domain-containing putative transcriptional regulator [Kineosporiaceae bacterium]|nr:BTAD domain-containing putative transcriptional regulator [Kineosporiaceae bacterium]
MTDQRLDLSAKFVPPEPTGLVRGRLMDRLTQRVGVVLAPAGHGKTTLLGQFAANFGGAVAWYRIDVGDRNPIDLATRMGRVLLKLSPGGAPDGGDSSFESLATILDTIPPTSDALLVLDDFHVIAGTESESRLVELISMAPPRLRVLLGARRAGGLDIEALRIYGGVRVMDADDLRFRSWEVETLFREVYRRPLLPEDAATLTRRTEGWAAGLAMFQLLTEGRAPAQRRQAIGELSRGSRLVRSYLVREVLGDLPPALRHFLRRTSALGVLTGDLCDRLLNTTGSQAILEELEQRRLFTTTHDDGRQFSYHQVLLDHLELELTERLGRDVTRQWYAHAGRLLLAAGEVPAAFRAYARAEDWAAVEQLLHARGAEVVATGLDTVAALLPVDLHSQDPWLLLARARQLVAQGALAEAVTTFKLARAVAEDSALADQCLAEARAAAIWLPEATGQNRGWPGLIRAATQRNPRLMLRDALALPGASGKFTAGIICLLSGDLESAASLLEQAASHPEAEPGVVAMARCADSLLRLLSSRSEGRDDPNRHGDLGWQLSEPDLESVVLEAEVDSRAWLVRSARALLNGRTDPIGRDADQDPWGRALAAFVDGVARRSAGALTEAADGFEQLRAPVLAQWAICLRQALSARDTTVPTEADRRARALGLRDAIGVIQRWAEPVAPTAVEAFGPESSALPGTAGPPALTLRLLGGLEITVAGQPLDLSAVRPRARSTLRRLALRAGEVVHRDSLAAGLWPDLDQDAAQRGLQVAVSSLRSLLEPAAPIGGSGRGRSSLLIRAGQNYGLSLPAGCRSDVQEFESCVSKARSARVHGDRPAERAHLEAGLALYRGDLLPEEGTAEWVLAERGRLRLAAAGAAEALARNLVDSGEVAEAIDAVRTCLRLEPYRDNAWRLLVELHTRAGNLAAAEAARLEHEEVLADLGL